MGEMVFWIRSLDHGSTHSFAAHGPPRYVEADAHITIFMGSSQDELPRYEGHIYVGYRVGDDGNRSLAGVAQRTANIVLFDTRTGEPIKA